MNFNEMTIDELETRRAEIATEVDTEGADLDALSEEIRGIKTELESRKAAEAKREEIRNAVASGKGEVVEEFKGVDNMPTKTLDEIRSSKEYVDAFAEYIKTEDDTECRALLSELATNGQVPVPTLTEGRIRTAWARAGLMDLVNKTYVKGILRVGFELSATGAVVHTEGAEAPTEETLTFGVVSLTPASIKKWIRISDEAIDLGGQEFLDYVYDEVTYRIAKEAQRQLINKIIAAPAASTASAVGVPSITGAPTDLSVVAAALANLSDEAANPVVVMNRLTHAEFMSAIVAASFMFDPFEGIDVYYDNTLDSYADASAGETWLIVGDFRVGAQANFPNGDDIRIKFDDLTDAEADLVKIVGREYVGIGLVAPNAFAKVVKPS